jgi:hypothetical protein
MFPVDPPISFYVIIHSIRYQQYHVGNFGSISLFECSKPKEMMLTIHRLYKNNQEAQERIRKIRELGYKNTSAIDLGNDGIRIQEIWCHECILNLKSVSKVNSK